MTVQMIRNAEDLAERYDIAIVGAGPAGMAAATECAKFGLRTIVFDENSEAGGQIYRAITRNTPAARPYLGRDYWRGASLWEAFVATTASYVPAAAVWSLEQQDEEAELRVSVSGRSMIVHAKRVILATGATERPMPVRGWTLPGVMSIGAAQIALKSAGLLPEGRAVLAGSGPLLYLYASQVLAAGGVIDAILDTTPRRYWLQAAPHLLPFLISPYVWKGLGLILKVTRAVRVFRSVTALEINGKDRADGVTFTAGGKTVSLPAKSVFLHQGVIPHANLANAAGCEMGWNDRQKCFAPVVDRQGRSTKASIFIAGDGNGIGGALVAEFDGRIAGLAAGLEVLGKEPSEDLRRYGRLRQKALRGRTFIDLLYQPAPSFRAPAEEDVIVCRCEEVSVGAIRAAADSGVAGPNQLKTMLRCGMGPCQGRMCAATVTEILADAQQRPPTEVGTYRLRPPIKPVPLSEIAALPHTPDAVYAVTGTHSEH
ncbi:MULTISPECIES: NAD(P)/FAD-dependent oxidoreductase [unclassified Rhizobium]|uniref:FAD/NAD(P)-dependent oxidoreductase n=1 Tax=unclassified Rhizobium TaxID=2613769 RepID=UPI0006FA3BD3|nr:MULTISPECIES: NAD(P)/FAD-dependent oxidoreductase [unclassified Rhizobium]KQV40825.1 FAD/NAD(P)-binding oxidoreductase [Rhizobium sp. Root1212]KRD36113.1 FAD/NAD(P)-binding oxidoreductase [Rhizobium sp. Root268]